MASFLPSIKRRSGTFEVNDEQPHFSVAYMGSVPSDVKGGEECTKTLVDNLCTALKGQSLPKMTLNITTKGITMKGQRKGTDEFIPIYAITYGAADPVHKRVFSFIESRHQGNGRKFFCHACLCKDATSCRVLILYLMKAFNIAYDEYMRTNKRKTIKDKIGSGPGRRTRSDGDAAPRMCANTIGTQTMLALPPGMDTTTSAIVRVSDWLERCVYVSDSSQNGFHGYDDRRFSEFERREREYSNPAQLNPNFDFNTELKDPNIQTAIKGYASSLYSDPPPPYKEFEDDPDDVFEGTRDGTREGENQQATNRSS
ncbi:uncharacterized protein LOC144449395 [Glandiceps talaboti]